MKRNPILNIIGSAIVFIYGLLLSSCTNNQSTWQETINGNKLFIDNSNYVYEWEGDTFDRLIHGEGVLKVYIKDSLIKTSSVTAYYGAISKDDIIYINDTTQYIGNVKRHKQNGFGVIIQPHNIYVGELHKSKPHGHLSWFQNGKLRYKGDWTEGRRDGYGTSYDKDGVYSGSFSNNFYNGEGEKSYDLGFSYYGEWLNGQRCGYGTFYADDLVYCGNFSNGLPCGNGSLSIGDSCFTYYGNWENGQICEYGECTYANGDCYRGNWLNNQFEGFGIYEYASGDVYEGDWKEGLQEGKGQYISDDFTYVGELEGGWINGEGQMNYANGDWYEGDFYQNERFGVGCYHFKNGNYYEGEFVNDTINGLGIFHFQDGSRYEGEFEDGKIFGDGTLYININDENVAITAFWDGTNNLPTEASVLFGNGDLYEGELINGTPTDNGIWTTQKERDSGKSLLGKANDLYKEHRDTWNKAVIITSSALAAVGIFAPYVGAAIGTIALGPAGTATGAKVGEAIAKCADIANEALNIVDASLAIGSAAYDVYEARENGEDPSDAYKTLATEIGMNVGLILLPKALKKIPIGKVIGKLSKPAAVKAAARIAQKAGKQISKVETKIAKTSAAKAASRITKTIGRKSKNGFQKIVQIGKDKYGNLEKRFLNSKVGVKTNKIYKSIKKRTDNIRKEVAKAKNATKTLSKKDVAKLAKKNKTIKQAVESLDPKLGVTIDDLLIQKSKNGSYIITWKKYPETCIKIQGNTIYANAGSTIRNGNVNQFLNSPLPNKTYIIDDGCFVYVTDDLGRVTEAYSDRTRAYETLNRNRQRNSDVQKKVIHDLDGKIGDDGGHLIANSTNGPNELINQVPMEHSIQANGEWRRFEEMEEKAIKEGKQVKSSRKILYDGNSKRPYAIEAKVEIDGKVFTKTIKI